MLYHCLAAAEPVPPTLQIVSSPYCIHIFLYSFLFYRILLYPARNTIFLIIYLYSKFLSLFVDEKKTGKKNNIFCSPFSEQKINETVDLEE